MTAFPVVLSAPSGAGKTTIVKRLVSGRSDLGFSISATTRPQRGDERDGTDYYFLTEAEFERRSRGGDFVETAKVHGHWYGTLRSELERLIGGGKHPVLEIDVQGARAIRRAFASAVLVFVLPPTAQVLVERLRGRQTESDEVVARRLSGAIAELEAAGEYDYLVVNDDIEAATARISAVINAESVRTARFGTRIEQIATLVAELRQIGAASS